MSGELQKLVSILENFKVRDRIYRLVPVMRECEIQPLHGYTIFERGQALSADMGEEHCRCILSCQDDLPSEFRARKVRMLFPTNRPGRERMVYIEAGKTKWLYKVDSMHMRWGRDSYLVERVG